MAMSPMAATVKGAIRYGLTMMKARWLGIAKLKRSRAGRSPRTPSPMVSSTAAVKNAASRQGARLATRSICSCGSTPNASTANATRSTKR